MEEGNISENYKNWNATDFNLSNSSVYSTNSQGNADAIIPNTRPISPSAIDFSQRSTTSPKSYMPGLFLDSNKLQKEENIRPYGNGTVNFNKDSEEITYPNSLDSSRRDANDRTNCKSIDGEKDESRNMKGKRLWETVKLVVVLASMAVGVVAVVVLVTGYNKPPPEPQRQVLPNEFDCNLQTRSNLKSGKLKLNTSIVIACTFPKDVNTNKSSLIMEFKPKYNIGHVHDKVEINSTLQSNSFRKGRWEIRISFPQGEGLFEFLGDPVKCGGDGQYSLALYTPNKNYTSVVNIEIESENSDVQLEVGQTEDDGTYKITCSSTSDCAPAPITLLGTLGNKVVPLFGVNFTCIIKYNDYDGWSVSCDGSIPKSVVSAIDEITCRPILKDQTEANQTEATISKDVLLCKDTKDCTFVCPLENQDKYYTDPRFCNIFHRCVNERLYTAPCGKGTYFSSKTCACSHINDVINDGSCNANGLRLQAAANRVLCDDSNGV